MHKCPLQPLKMKTSETALGQLRALANDCFLTGIRWMDRTAAASQCRGDRISNRSLLCHQRRTVIGQSFEVQKQRLGLTVNDEVIKHSKTLTVEYLEDIFRASYADQVGATV